MIICDALLSRLAVKHLNVEQKRYKSNHDKKVRFKPLYASGNYAIIDRPYLITSAAERLATEDYPKPTIIRHGLYCMLNVSHEYLKLLQQNVENAASIHSVTRATKKGRVPVQLLSRLVRPEEMSPQRAT